MLQHLAGPVLLLLLGVCSQDSARCADGQGRCAGVDEWNTQGSLYEYGSVANPPMSQVPIRVFPPAMHKTGPSAVKPLDLSRELELPYPATVPNLLASFIRVVPGEQIVSSVSWATSQSFYVIRGRGSSKTRTGTVGWKTGDLFVLPYLGDDAPAVCEPGNQCVQHSCVEEPEFGGCAIYWVHDEPLLRYLGVRPVDTRRFEPALYPGDVMRSTVASIPELTAEGVKRNRRGILLSNNATNQTKTLTQILWSLLNSVWRSSAHYLSLSKPIEAMSVIAALHIALHLSKPTELCLCCSGTNTELCVCDRLMAVRCSCHTSTTLSRWIWRCQGETQARSIACWAEIWTARDRLWSQFVLSGRLGAYL